MSGNEFTPCYFSLEALLLYDDIYENLPVEEAIDSITERKCLDFDCIFF